MVFNHQPIVYVLPHGFTLLTGQLVNLLDRVYAGPGPKKRTKAILSVACKKRKFAHAQNGW